MSTATTEQSRVSRPLLIVLGIVAVAAVAYLALTLLGGSSDQDGAETSEPVAAASEPSAASEAASEPSERGSEVAVVEPTFEVFDARDPFEQLVDDTTSTDATVGTTAPTSATTPVDGTQPADATAPVDGTQPTSGDPSQTTVGATTIRLDDVFTNDGVTTALVVVDNEGYEATAGDTVAGVTVLDIAQNCATLRYEDKRFILCEGEQVQK